MKDIYNHLLSNFHSSGYGIAHINTEIGKIVSFYGYSNSELYIIMLADSDSGITANIMAVAVDTVRNRLLKDDVFRVNVLQIVIRNDNRDVNDIVSPFFPFWIIDSRENRLIIYENQPADFLRVRSIIEDSLDGVDYSGNDSVISKNNKHFPLITAIIVLINVIVFILLEINGSTLDTEYMLEHGALRYAETVTGGQFYRLITHFFMHFGIDHIVNNMFVLIILGYHIENAVGKVQFLVIYMMSGLIAGIISMNWYYMIGQDSVSAGASGAIFGITGALFALFFMNRGKMINMSITRIILFLALTIYSGMRDTQIDLAAHIGGFIVGAAVTIILQVGKRLIMPEGGKKA